MKIRILPFLGFLFTLTIVSRAFALSGDALTPQASAKTDNHKIAGPQTTSTPHEPQDHKAKKQHPPAQCLTGDMLMATNAKMAQLTEREAQMKERESAYSAIQTRLDEQLIAVEAAKASLDENVNERTKLAQEDISHLTLMYQSMKPKQAAKIFNEMDANFAAGFLREMKGSQAGLILSNMDAKKAYKISIIIASRRAEYR